MASFFMEGDMMTQSSLYTGTELVGFRAYGVGVMSSLYTESDRGTVDKNSNGHP